MWWLAGGLRVDSPDKLSVKLGKSVNLSLRRELSGENLVEVLR